jgi:hypothetical protein
MSKLHLSLDEKLQVFFNGPFVYIGLLFTVIGGLVFFVAMESAVFKSLIFEFNEPVITTGVVTKIGESNTTIIDYEVYELIYSYRPVGSTLTTSFKTFKTDVFMESELLVYSKRDNSKVVLLKKMPVGIAKKIISRA